MVMPEVAQRYSLMTFLIEDARFSYAILEEQPVCIKFAEFKTTTRILMIN